MVEWLAGFGQGYKHLFLNGDRQALAQYQAIPCVTAQSTNFNPTPRSRLGVYYTKTENK